MQPSAALAPSVPLAPPVTPLAGAGKPRARLRPWGCGQRAAGDVRRNNAVAARGPALRHCAAAARPRAAPSLCRPKGKSALPIQHNRRYAKPQRPRPQPARLRITMLCLAPRPAVLCGVAAPFPDVGEAAPPPRPRLCAVALRATAFNSSPARPRVAFARLQPCGLALRARCASHPSAPEGLPQSSGDCGGARRCPGQGSAVLAASRVRFAASRP